MNDDLALLREYSRNASEDAFAAIVDRHLKLVYTTALRRVRSAELADEFAQSVFIRLARNAGSLKSGTVLAAWLYRVTRHAAIDLMRGESRRQLREQNAFEVADMNSPSSEWARVEPFLDEAVEALNEPDRAAILLRYFENKSLQEVGETLGISADAAQKRVSRSLDQLRARFSKRGVAIGATGLTAILASQGAQGVPVELAVKISIAVTTGMGTAVTTTAATATKTIAMSGLHKTVIAASFTILAGAGVFEASQTLHLRRQVQELQHRQAPLTAQVGQLRQERDDARNRLARLENDSSGVKSNNDELLRLRGNVSVLRQRLEDASRKADDAEQKLEAELSAKTQFTDHQSATTYAAKQLTLALLIFSGDHNDQFPTNAIQLKKELNGSFQIRGISAFAFEYFNPGRYWQDHPNMITLRERLARQAPDGAWKRIYGFADGSVHIATSPDGNFDSWERVNTYQSPSTQRDSVGENQAWKEAGIPSSFRNLAGLI